jgi:hypothetical protein
MGSILSWCADQDKREHDREADRRLKALKSSPSGIFTVYELHFLMNPHGKYSSDWTEYSVKQVNEIYERVKDVLPK